MRGIFSMLWVFVIKAVCGSFRSALLTPHPLAGR